MTRSTAGLPAVLRLALALLACTLAVLATASAASAAPGEFKVGDKVEADYYDSGKWTDAVVVEIIGDGFKYRVKGDFRGDGKPFETELTHYYVRADTADEGEPADREKPAGPPRTGKYGCAESVYNGDGYTSETRGFITLLRGNRYRQGKGKVGRYRYNRKTGVTRFTGGGLDKSTATAIDGKRTRLFITVRFTSGDEARWACSRVGSR